MEDQLFTKTTYDANKELTVLACGVASSEDSETRSFFLRNCLQCFPTVALPMSDRAKGVERQQLRSCLDSQGVQRSRCLWHISRKNRKAAKVRYSDDEMRHQWNMVRSRKRYRAELLLSELTERNNELGGWARFREQHCWDAATGCVYVQQQRARQQRPGGGE